LTERELEVLKLIASGLKDKEIGSKLFISQNTVRFQAKSTDGKLNVNNSMQAVQVARRLLIISFLHNQNLQYFSPAVYIFL